MSNADIGYTVWGVSVFLMAIVGYAIWCSIPTLDAEVKNRWMNGSPEKPKYKGTRRKGGVAVWLHSWIPRLPRLLTPAPHGDGSKEEKP